MGKNIEIGLTAPDFTLVDVTGKDIRLSEYEGKKIVLLALIRGFA